MKKILGIIALALAAIALVGYTSHGADSQAPVHITLKAGQMRYLPLALHLKAGVPVHLELRNEDNVVHDLNVPGLTPGAKVTSGHAGHEHHGQGANSLHLAAEPGKSAAVMFTPKAGEYIFYCSVPGHREAGMTGKFTVH